MNRPLRTIAVSGASGFIGGHVAHEAEVRGYRVIRGGFRRARAGSGWRIADLRVPQEALAFVSDADAVIHCAALVGTMISKMRNPATLMSDNLRMTMNLAESLVPVGAHRLVLVSSAEIYAGNSDTFEEGDGFTGTPNGPNVGYVWSKRMSEVFAELAARQYDFDLGVVRPNNVFGPGDDYAAETARAVPAMLFRALTGKDIILWGDGSQIRSFLYVADLARAILDVTESGVNQGAINVGSTEYVKLEDLACLIVDKCASSSRIQRDPTKPAGPLRRLVSTAKAERLIGFSPQFSLAQGIDLCVADARRRLGLDGQRREGPV